MASAPTADLVQNWTASMRTATGAQIRIRPLLPDDREREIAFINSLSDRSRYLRLFAPLKFLPPHLIDQLMDIDYQRRMAFVATIERDGKEEFVGIARYAETDQSGVVELGITVTDAWHRQGIARLLVDRLISFARWRGIRRIVGAVLPENQPMICLAVSLGFQSRFDSTQHAYVISRDLTHIPDDVPAM